MPPAMPNTPEMKDDRTMVTPMMASEAGVIADAILKANPEVSRPRQRTVDHVDGVLQPIDRDKRAEARALLLAEQHLVQHVEPVERDARLAVLGLLLLVEERRPAPDVI